MEEALQPIQFLLQYRLSKSSKVNDFHLVWQGVPGMPLPISD